MTVAVETAERSGREGARIVPVWDPLVRMIHWSLAACILLNGAILEEESVFHEWSGYIAAGLVALRLVWGLVGARHARFSAFPPSPRRALAHAGEMLSGSRKVHLSHNPLGALMAYNLWASVIGMGITGWMMGTIAFFGVEWVEELHELIFNWMMLSVALHLAGVAFDTWRSGVPLARAMVDGRKRIPEGAEIE